MGEGVRRTVLESCGLHSSYPGINCVGCASVWDGEHDNTNVDDFAFLSSIVIFVRSNLSGIRRVWFMTYTGMFMTCPSLKLLASNWKEIGMRNLGFVE